MNSCGDEPIIPSGSHAFMSAFDAEYLTGSEAAALLCVAPSTIRRWIRAGQTSAYRLGPRPIALRRAELARLGSPVIPDRDVMEMPPAGESPRSPPDW